MNKEHSFFEKQWIGYSLKICLFLSKITMVHSIFHLAKRVACVTCACWSSVQLFNVVCRCCAINKPYAAKDSSVLFVSVYTQAPLHNACPHSRRRREASSSPWFSSSWQKDRIFMSLMHTARPSSKTALSSIMFWLQSNLTKRNPQWRKGYVSLEQNLIHRTGGLENWNQN